MKHPLNKIVLFVAGVILLSSCEEKTTSMQKSMGKSAEIVVASDQNSMDKLKPLVLDIFEDYQPYFPMTGETYFNAIPINFRALKGALLKNKTILLLITDANKNQFEEKYGLNIDEVKLKMKDEHFTVLKDLWARPQHVAILYAKTSNEMIKYLQKHGSFIRSAMLEAEAKDLSRKYSKSPKSKSNYEILKKEFGCGVMIPATFKLDHQKDGFFWFREVTDNYTSSIIVHAYPYTDTSQFNNENIIAMRDSLTKYNIPGPSDGTFMSTSSSDKYPRFTETRNVNGNYVKTIRSWWTVKGEFYSGPFTRFVFHHKETNQLVAVEGFLESNGYTKNRAQFYRVFDALVWSFE